MLKKPTNKRHTITTSYLNNIYEYQNFQFVFGIILHEYRDCLVPHTQTDVFTVMMRHPASKCSDSVISYDAITN